MKHVLLVIALLLLITGCSTVKTPPWSKEEISSFIDHEVESSLVVMWRF